jgi:diguanylate cyclase (GGDEF)-like protein
MIKNWTWKLIEDLFDVHSREQLLELISCRDHPQVFQAQRASLINQRVHSFAYLFAILVPLWAVLDFIFLPFEIALSLLWLRLGSGAIFAVLARVSLLQDQDQNLTRSHVLLWVLMFVPSFFFIFSQPILADVQLTGWSSAMVNLYGLLPYVVMAALSIFPLTLREFVGLTLPLALLNTWAIWPEDDTLANHLTELWLMWLIIGTSFFSSFQQMRTMNAQVRRASFDALTGIMTRRAGIDTIDLMFKATGLQESPMCLLFVDIDHFKSVNDTFGHETGDQVLIQLATCLKEGIRKGDGLFRWGGEEFVVVLPHTDCAAAQVVVERIYAKGFGFRPDNTPLTVSMGLAEVITDHCLGWKCLVEKADARLYEAKESGRGRCIGKDHRLVAEIKKA